MIMHARSSRSILIFCGLVILFAAVMMPAAARAEDSPEVYFGFESFTWEEFDDFGQKLLEESGPRIGVGFAMHKVFEGGFTLKPRVELFWGTVDYDGATQAGEPVLSETDYLGFKAEIDMGGQVGQGVRFEPFGGIGLRFWDRTINDSITVLGTQAIGYTEEWYMAYFRVGFRLQSPPEDAFQGFFELGARIPLYTENTALLSEKFSAADVTFEPGNRTSLFAEAGFRAEVFKLTAFYESLRFKPSDSVMEPVSGLLLYQPESEADIFGVRVGASF